MPLLVLYLHQMDMQIFHTSSHKVLLKNRKTQIPFQNSIKVRDALSYTTVDPFLRYGLLHGAIFLFLFTYCLRRMHQNKTGIERKAISPQELYHFSRSLFVRSLQSLGNGFVDILPFNLQFCDCFCLGVTFVTQKQMKSIY